MPNFPPVNIFILSSVNQYIIDIVYDIYPYCLLFKILFFFAVRAIYSQTEPQFLQYIYLVAPISLLILNPIGFVMMDIHKASLSNIKRYILTDNQSQIVRKIYCSLCLQT